MEYSVESVVVNKTDSFQVKLLSKQDLELEGIENFVSFKQKMNIMAVSESFGKLFVACGDFIRVAELAVNYCFKNQFRIYIPQNSEVHSTVNNLKIEKVNQEEMLVVVTMDSRVIMYWLYDLERPPVVFSNFDSNFYDNSTWSVSAKGGVLAVGSNSHTISVWDLETQDFKRLNVHSHNVPCIELSPSGRFIASTSIDSTVCISDHTNKLKVCKPCAEWGWAVKWVPKNSVSEFKSLPQTNINRLNGRYYSSKYPTTYVNFIRNMPGAFNIGNAGEYFNLLRRRLEGRPDRENNFQEQTSDSELARETFTDPEVASHFILHASKFSLHLIDPCIDPQQPHNNMHVLATFVPQTEIIAQRFTRLSLLEYFPEFGMVILGNQGGRELNILRIARKKRPETKQEWKEFPSLYYEYSFHTEAVIMLEGDLLGMHLSKDLGDQDKVRVYLLTELMILYILEIAKSKVPGINDINI